MKVGTRVRYIRIDTEEDKMLGYYPPIGTFGTVAEIDEDGMRVKWDNGTNGDGEWWCDIGDVENIIYEEEDKEALYSLMANYFYDCHMNGHSEFEMWCKDDIKNDKQKNLFKAINDHVEFISDILFN